MSRTRTIWGLGPVVSLLTMIFSNWSVIGEPAEAVDGELEWLVAGGRRGAQLPGGNLDVLVLDGVQHIGGGETELS